MSQGNFYQSVATATADLLQNIHC